MLPWQASSEDKPCLPKRCFQQSTIKCCRQDRACQPGLLTHHMDISYPFPENRSVEASNSHYTGLAPLIHASTMSHCYGGGDGYFQSQPGDGGVACSRSHQKSRCLHTLLGFKQSCVGYASMWASDAAQVSVMVADCVFKGINRGTRSRSEANFASHHLNRNFLYRRLEGNRRRCSVKGQSSVKRLLITNS